MILAAQRGDRSARNTLIERNLGLIRHVIRKLIGDRADSINENLCAGVLGFIKAIEVYDSSKGAFNTVVGMQIRSKLTVQYYAEQRDRLRGFESFGQMEWVVGRASEVVELAVDVGRLVELVAELPVRDQVIVVDRMQGKTLERTGSEVGLGKERVRQLGNRAYKALRAGCGLARGSGSRPGCPNSLQR